MQERPPRRREGRRSASPAKANKFKQLCYGCGAPLQMDAASLAGFIEPERYVLKARHRQLHTALCCRCRSLSQGEMLPAVVEGRLSGAGGAGIATPEELRDELLHIRERKVLAVVLVDIMDITGSFLPRVRDLIAGNPVLLVGTKADLLPAGTDVEAVRAWMAEVLTSQVNVLGVHLISARTGDGMGLVCKEIMSSRSGRDVYVLGAANVGKSMFIASLVEKLLGGRPRRLPISSSTPGTTLRTIAVEAFEGGSDLYDTPGVHLAHRVGTLLLPEELKAMVPRSRVKPFTPQPRGKGFAGSSFFWGGLARFDVVAAPLALRLTFNAFGLRVAHCEHTADAERFYSAEAGVSLTPPLSRDSAAELGGLQLARAVELQLVANQHVADISISGLGWVGVSSLATLAQPSSMATTINVWVPRGVKVSIRPPMPTGGLPC